MSMKLKKLNEKQQTEPKKQDFEFRKGELGFFPKSDFDWLPLLNWVPRQEAPKVDGFALRWERDRALERVVTFYAEGEGLDTDDENLNKALDDLSKTQIALKYFEFGSK